MNQKLRDDMMALYGQLCAISFPMIWKGEEPQAYYDLIDNMIEQYKSILKRLFEDFEDD